MAFSDGLSAGVYTAASLQQIRARKNAYEHEKLVNQADNFARQLSSIVGPEGDMTNLNPDQLAAVKDLLNANSELVGQRPGGTAVFNRLVSTPQGVAAEVTVTDPKTGKTSTGPITKKGTSEDSDPIVTVQNAKQLTDPIYTNLQRAIQQASGNSADAYTLLQGRKAQTAQDAALETLYGGGGGAQSQQQVPSLGAAPLAPSAQPQAPSAQPQAPGPAQSYAAPQTPTPQGTPLDAQGQPVQTAAPAAGADMPNFKYTGPAQDPQVASVVTDAATANGVDPNVLQALVQHESGGKIDAQSPTGAIGLGQITNPAMDEVNRVYKTNYTRDQMRADPKANADVAAKYLKLMLKRNGGDLQLALEKYNADYTNKADPEAKKYPGKVMKYLAASDQAPSTQSSAPGATDAQGAAKLAADAKAGKPGPQLDSTEVDQMIADAKANGTPKQQEVAKEMQSTPAPASTAEVAKAVDTVKAVKPAQKLTAEQRKAIYTLHRLDPQQFPLDSVMSALETGRLTQAKLSFFKNGADQIIGVDQQGNQIVLPDTPEAQKMRQIEMSSKLATAQLNMAQGTQQLEKSRLDMVKQKRDQWAETNASLWQRDGDPNGNDFRKGQAYDAYVRTTSVLGVDMGSEQGQQSMNQAAKIQQTLHDKTHGRWFDPFTWGGRDITSSNNLVGILTMNDPTQQYDTTDPKSYYDAGVHTLKTWVEPLKAMGMPDEAALKGTALGQTLLKNGFAGSVDEANQAVFQLYQKNPAALNDPGKLLQNMQYAQQQAAAGP